MKVILMEEMPGLGEPGQIVTVADGYARNFLLPRKRAIEASQANLKNLKHHQQAIGRKQARHAASARAVAERIGQISLQLSAKAGEGGRLYGSITSGDIAEALERDFSITVDRRKIELPNPIKVLGPHSAVVRLHRDAVATLSLEVLSAGGEPAPAEAEAPAASNVEEPPAAPSE